MTESNSPSRFLGRDSGETLSRIAEALHDDVPFTRPEVVRLDGDSQGVRMQVGPGEYLLLMYADGQWLCGDVYVDAETGRPDRSPLVQRLMQESYRPLPVSDPAELSGVVHGLLKRAITGWSVTAEHAFATERERQFAAEALAKSSQLRKGKPPTRP